MPPSVKSSCARLGPTAKSLIPTSFARTHEISPNDIVTFSSGFFLCARASEPESRFVHAYRIVAVAFAPFPFVPSNTPSTTDPSLFVTSTTYPLHTANANATRAASSTVILPRPRPRPRPRSVVRDDAQRV